MQEKQKGREHISGCRSNAPPRTGRRSAHFMVKNIHCPPCRHNGHLAPSAPDSSAYPLPNSAEAVVENVEQGLPVQPVIRELTNEIQLHEKDAPCHASQAKQQIQPPHPPPPSSAPLHPGRHGKRPQRIRFDEPTVPESAAVGPLVPTGHQPDLRQRIGHDCPSPR